MKKYTLLLLLALSFFSGQTFAQDDDKDKDKDEEEVVYYNLVENAPIEGKNLSVAVNPLVVDVYDPNLSFSAGINAFYRFGTLFAVEGSYDFAYADRIKPEEPKIGSSRIVPVYESVSARNWQVLGRVYFLSNLEDFEESITVKSERKKGVDHITNTFIPSKRGVLYAFRGGITSGLTGLYSESGVYPYKGTPVEGSNSGTLTELDEVFLNTMEYQYVSFGISRTRLRDLVLELQGYGERESKSYAEFYCDVLYATKISYDNVYIGSDVNTSNNNHDEFGNYVEYDLSESDKSKLGGRLGVIYKSTNTLGTYVNAEIGVRPGFPKGYYLLIKMGLNISGRVAAN